MKKILAVLLLTIVSLAGHAQSGQRIYTALMPIQGSTYAQLIPSAKVYLCVYNDALSCVTPVNVYSDRALTHLITQPVVASPTSAVYSYYVQAGTLLVEKVCAPYNQCTSNPVLVSGAGGANCGGLAGQLLSSDGAGNCVATNASYNSDLTDGFMIGGTSEFGNVLTPIQLNGDASFGVYIGSASSNHLVSDTGFIVTDGETSIGTIEGEMSITENGQGGIAFTDNGGGYDFNENNVSIPSTLDGGGWTVNSSGGWDERNSETGTVNDFGFTIFNDTNPNTLTPGFDGEYGINITDDTADGIYIDEQGSGKINLAANNINLLTSATANLKGNGSQICTLATGCGSSGGTTLNPNPATTAYVFYNDSRFIVVDDTTYCQSDGFNSSLQSYLPAITSATVSGGVATFTYTAPAAAPITGNILYLNGFTGTLSALNGQVVTVSGTGSGTFTATVTGVSNGSYTDSGTAPCAYNAPRHFQQSPLIIGHGKVVNASIGGGTTATMDSNFATLISSNATVTAAISAGSPIYLYLMTATNDFNTGTCPTVSTLEGHMTSIMAKFHALASNAKVILVGPPPAVLGTGTPGCGTAVTLFRQMNQDLRQLYAGNPTNVAAGTYYDDYIDMTGLYQSMSSSMVGPGGIHWNKAGGAYMGQAAAVEAGIYQNKMDPTPSVYVYNYADLSTSNSFNSGGNTHQTVIGSSNAGMGWDIQDAGSGTSVQFGLYHNISFMFFGGANYVEFQGGGLAGTKYGIFPDSAGFLGFRSNTGIADQVDTAFTRDSAGVMDLGNGTAGDKSGSLNLANLNVSGTCTGCGGGSGLSGMTTGQVGVAGSPTTITSSKAIAGSGAGLTSGPTSSTSGDVATFSGTSGQIQDSSVLLSSLALLASPTFTGVPAAPTATGGTNTTQLATTAFVQAAIAAAGTGAGIVTYSGPSLTFTGTQYFPIGGGATSSTTETNVDIDSPAAVTIQNMTVQMSAAPGVGASIVFTWRKNAAGTVLTCTISGASATSCSDTTHNFTTAALDLLDIQTVTTGSVVGTPTVVMAAQVGIAATATTAFSAISGGTNTMASMVVGSGASLAPSGTGTINANQINGATVPTSAAFLGSNGSNQLVSATLPINVQFVVNTGVAASPAAVYLTAPNTGTITACTFTTTTSDGSTDLSMNVKLAGTSIFSGSSQTITHGTSGQTQTTLTLTGTINVTAGNIWEFDISAGTSAWTGSLLCH